VLQPTPPRPAPPHNSSVNHLSFPSSFPVGQIASEQEPNIMEQEGQQWTGSLAAVLRVLQGGARLAVDDAWPSQWRTLMAACWGADPDTRPTFPQAAGVLERMGPAHAEV